MNIQELKDALSNTSAISLGKSKQPNVVALKTRLMDATNWCPEDYSIATRIFIVMNGVVEVPKCVCGECTVPNKLNNKLGFSKYCSILCNQKYSRLPKEATTKLADHDWMYEQRITKKLSKESIAELLDVSTQAINTSITNLGIPDVKYVWTENATTEEIRDRTVLRLKTQIGVDSYESLYNTDIINNLYYDSGLSIAAISRKLGVHENSVSVAADFKELVLEERTYYVHKSIGETSLGEFISSIIECEFNYRSGGYRTPELDIFIPSLNIGIEYNGCYFHSDKFREVDYHANKVEHFSKLGIRVIQIWSDSWLCHTERTKSFLLNILQPKKPIGARKTTCALISQPQYDEFMERFHMQGSTTTGIRVGVFFEGELKSVMGFRKIAENINKTGYELIRFANDNVVGSFSKALKFFKQSHEGDIYSFGDLETVDPRKNVYLTNGFKEINRIKPDYKYFDRRTGERTHKFNYRKSKFKKLGFDIEGKTERQLADSYGLIRCYDSGKVLYMI